MDAERFAAAMSGLREAVVVVDRDRRITNWTAGAPRIFGWSERDVLGRDIDEIFRPKDSNGNPCCIGASDLRRVIGIERGTPEQEILVTTRRGAEAWVAVSSSYLRDAQGRVEQAVAILRPIAHRKKIDLAKSEVISAVSHELRSPLTSVKGFTSTLLARWDRLDDDAKKHLLETINTDADRLTRLIGELLDVSRLESGKLQLHRSVISVPGIARRVVDRLSPQTESHTITPTFPDGFPEALADEDKVHQVLTNLIENAVKYTSGGAVEVTGHHDGNQLTVTVSDEGEGIPPEHRLKVFGKFFRRGERTGRPSGTGLGLYISKGLVEAHGGRIWVGEAPGGGAAFSFTLPAAPATGEQEAPDGPD